MNINLFLVIDLFYNRTNVNPNRNWGGGGKSTCIYRAHPKHLAVTLTISLFMFWYTSALLVFSKLA